MSGPSEATQPFWIGKGMDDMGPPLPLSTVYERLMGDDYPTPCGHCGGGLGRCHDFLIVVDEENSTPRFEAWCQRCIAAFLVVYEHEDQALVPSLFLWRDPVPLEYLLEAA